MWRLPDASLFPPAVQTESPGAELRRLEENTIETVNSLGWSQSDIDTNNINYDPADLLVCWYWPIADLLVSVYMLSISTDIQKRGFDDPVSVYCCYSGINVAVFGLDVGLVPEPTEVYGVCRTYDTFPSMMKPWLLTGCDVVKLKMNMCSSLQPAYDEEHI